ncbi:MAG: zinc ribbon domain-containing protein [Oscillospiraceae bacterium]|nr:zinc ribbon domain-containing protein [Oscillospiraceae bacterium]
MVATFEDVVSKAKSVAETAGKKTSDFIEVTKLRLDVAELEREMTAIFEGLGRMVYDAKKSGEDASSLVDDCVERLDECQSQIDDLRRKIDEYRYAVRCKMCGLPNPNDAVYCKKCGAKIER